MAQQIIDLDQAVPESLIVKLGGKRYKLPGDIPIPDYLAIQRLSNSITEAAGEADGEQVAQVMEELYERVLELFRIEQPDLEELPLGPQRLGALVVAIYTRAAEEDADATDPPTRRAGTRSSSSRRKSRSRSSK